ADPGDHGLVASELRDQALCQVGAVEHLDSRSIDRRRGHVPHLNLAAAAGFPPVSSGEKMNTTGLCVVNACLIDLSTMNGMVASSVSVWCATAIASSVGRMVRATVTWPMLNSPKVPRSDTAMIAGIW